MYNEIDELQEKHIEALREFYFNEDNEVEKELSEEGFKKWISGLSWIEITDLTGLVHPGLEIEDEYE